MSNYSQQDNYWTPPAQNQYNFDNSGFGQPNQQFEFASYNDQQSVDYAYNSQQEYLNPNQSSYGGDLYTPDNYNQGIYSIILHCYSCIYVLKYDFNFGLNIFI